MGLRLRWFPWLEIGFFLPIATSVLWGGWLAWNGYISIAAATAVTLYVQQLLDPLGELISWLDEIQFAATSLARILGVAEVPPDRVATGALPDGEEVEVDDVRYAYREGRDVLHGVSLDLVPGERLAIVGPSGAGKSTLGRLMAGIDGPRAGRVTGGGVPLVDLDLPVLRGEVALVTQEHHVFVGTLAENLRLPRPDASDADLRAALGAVDALEWAMALPEGLDTVVGSGGHSLTEGQAQQLALARLVLADPHTLVLDEATSLLDPRAARHLERSLAAVVDGRTVVAIAHRLHTAHDADRVAVVEDGRRPRARLARRAHRPRRLLRGPVAVVARRGLGGVPGSSASTSRIVTTAGSSSSSPWAARTAFFTGSTNAPSCSTGKRRAPDRGADGDLDTHRPEPAGSVADHLVDLVADVLGHRDEPPRALPPPPDASGERPRVRHLGGHRDIVAPATDGLVQVPRGDRLMRHSRSAAHDSGSPAVPRCRGLDRHRCLRRNRHAGAMDMDAPDRGDGRVTRGHRREHGIRLVLAGPAGRRHHGWATTTWRARPGR